MKLHAASSFPAHSTKMLQGNMLNTGVFMGNQNELPQKTEARDRLPDLQAHVFLHPLVLRGT